MSLFLNLVFLKRNVFELSYINCLNISMRCSLHDIFLVCFLGHYSYNTCTLLSCHPVAFNF